jgi:hypothetical protein
MGLPIASIYIVLLMLFIPFPFMLPSAMGPAVTGPFPHEEVSRRARRPVMFAFLLAVIDFRLPIGTPYPPTPLL